MTQPPPVPWPGPADRLATVGAVRHTTGRGAAAPDAGAVDPATDWGPPTRARRVMRVVGPLLGIVWAVFLLQPFGAAWDHPPGVTRVVSLVAVVGLAGVFAWVVVRGAGPFATGVPRERALLVLGSEAVLVALSTLAAREVGLVGLIFLCVSSIFLLRDPRALLLTAVSGALIVALPRLLPGWEPIDDLLVSLVLATTAVFGFSQLVIRNRQLQLARDEVAVLAVERERERIARDMHDILGHSLTVISVKAELAGRLLDLDAERARTEIAEVQGLARSALADVRGMVTATRAVTLAGELAGARQAYDAAGIEAEVPGSVDEVPDRLRVLFAWALREATTNVLRHAAATRVRVTITPDTLTVDDDGTGPDDGPDSGPGDTAAGTGPGAGRRRGPHAPEPGAGNGLDGLGTRARQAGARLELSRSPLGGYRLRVTTQDGAR